MKKIIIVDYGMGNLWSVVNALKYLEADCVVSNRPDLIKNADTIILPGVGSFKNAIAALRQKSLIDPLREAVEVKKRKILGICLGFQLMTESSSEDGYTAGLNFINGNVKRFESDEMRGEKVPHIGFNRVNMPNNEGIFLNFGKKADFYFVHSYRLIPHQLSGQIATCNHGIKFVAAYQNENIFGTQFHPEKSQTNGLILLRNFLAI
ncbi:MAG: imidazole glycerol phosphate synthase subunit HisH [Porticoccus sp.]|jgi:glutamine amidotransferase|nr:imidazole glycerol phosphate synthase subunit HisH [Porticoccus sp.]|tara:strand:+ start:3353 stop:3973 length:621 start_codon:yes stop_codon:yes gene_type:complete